MVYCFGRTDDLAMNRWATTFISKPIVKACLGSFPTSRMLVLLISICRVGFSIQACHVAVGFLLFAATSVGFPTSFAASPPLTHWSISDARNFQRRPALCAGILLRVIHL